MPQFALAAGNELSRWCLVTSIAAIGMRTRLGDIVKLGIRPVILMLAETILLAVMVLILLKCGVV